LLESSGIFTVNNVAIVVGSTLIGVWAFSERPEPRNWLGVILAVLSILAVSLG
jgi:drug/metabolite transporter (DMT)-like permease